jgi:hypothetical protein
MPDEIATRPWSKLNAWLAAAGYVVSADGR